MKNKAIALALLLSVVGCSESNKEATEEAKKRSHDGNGEGWRRGS